MPFWLKSKALAWTNPERASSRYSSKSQVYARRRPRRRRTATIVLSGSLTEAPVVESLVAYCCQSNSDRIPEEILGIDWKLLEASTRCGEPSSRPCQNQVGQRSWQAATTVERVRTKVIAGRLLCAVHYGRCRQLTPYST